MIDTKPNLSDNKFEQCTSDILRLSGCTHIFGKFQVQSGATLSILPNRGTSKVLTSNSGGTATWQVIPIITPLITGATNGLGVTNRNICLGGTLTQSTNINLNGNNLTIIDGTSCLGLHLTPNSAELGDCQNKTYVNVIPTEIKSYVESANAMCSTVICQETCFITYQASDATQLSCITQSPITIDLLTSSGVSICMDATLDTIYFNTGNGAALSLCGLGLDKFLLQTIADGYIDFDGGGFCGQICATNLYVCGPSSMVHLSGSSVSLTGTIKLLSTPSNGASTDSILVWNSTTSEVNKVPYLSGTTLSAANGLSTSGANIILGGLLTGDTCINIDAGCICFTDTSGNNIFIHSVTSTDIYHIDVDSLSNISSSVSQAIMFSRDCAPEIIDGEIKTSYGCTCMYSSNNVTGCLLTFSMTPSAMTIAGSVSNFAGAQYNDNYSSKFTARSIPDAAYVTGLTSAIVSTITGGTNGLSTSGANIVLGGTLTGATTIKNGAYPFTISGNSFGSACIINKDGIYSGEFSQYAGGFGLLVTQDSGFTGGITGIALGVITIFGQDITTLNDSRIDVNDSTICFYSSHPLFQGVTYNDVCAPIYRPKYICNSLVDAAYVTGKTSTISVPVTGATNLGSGNGTIYTSVSNKKIQLKTLSGGTNVTLTCNGNYIGINVSSDVDLIWTGNTANGVGTYVDSTHICSQPNMTFDGTQLKVTGNVCATTCVTSPITCGTSCVLSPKFIENGTCLASTYLPFTMATDWQTPTGFVNNSSIDVSYDYVQRKITLTGTLDYYWNGVKKTLTSPWTSSAHTTTTGAWFLYSTDGTNIAWSQSVWAFNNLEVALVNYKSTSGTTFGVRETHSMMPWSTHQDFHKNIGTYLYSGGLATSWTASTATDTANSPNFNSAVIADEDIQTTIAAITKGAYTLMRVSGATSIYTVGSTTPFSGATNSYIRVNDPTTGGWVAGINTRYYNVYQFLIPTTSDVTSQKFRTIILQPQATYTTLASAQAEDSRGLYLGSLVSESNEFIPYARITYLTNAANTNYGKVTIPTGGITYIVGNRMGSTSMSGVVSPTNHANLTNLTWTNSGHVGTNDSFAAFDATGSACNTLASTIAKYCAIIISGNSSATGFTVNHAMSRQFVNVQVAQAASPYATVYTTVQRPNANCVCVTFDTAPTTGTNYCIIITG